MKFLKKRSTAASIAVIAVVVFGLLGMYRSASSQAKTVRETFSGGNFCITAQLQNRCANAMSMYTLSSNETTDTAEAVRAARSDLYDAIAAGAGPSALYRLNATLQEAVEVYYARLGTVTTLSDSDREYLDKNYSNFKEAQRVIESDDYNSTVRDYEDRVLGTFPLTVFRAILPINEPELFA